jgi:phosphoglycolate phosphatase (TIGR01487 family)
MAGTRLIISDFDGTFTDKTLLVDEGLAEAIREAKKRGVFFSIVSGRSYDFMEEYCGKLGGLVDSFVVENGCIGHFNGKKYVIGNCPDRKPIFDSLDRQGVPYGIGEVFFAVGRCDEGKLMATLSGFDGAFHVIRNVNTLMVLPSNVSKASGAGWLAGMHGVSREEIAAIGDAENDVHLREACGLLGAVSNAIPEMKAASDYVCTESYGKGVREFVEYAAGGR